MPGAFLPILGLVASAVMSFMFRPKTPKAPDPAPIPKAPEPAPLPEVPEPPKAEEEPVVSAEDSAASAKDLENRRKRQAKSALTPLEIQDDDSSNAKTLLGE